ncbi:MAG: radical SAM protein [Planctomycetota bacterium]|nr:radical SAM protein [Planctomycetota bacterium]
MSDRPKRGFPVVLTADRSLMAGYRILFEGMMLCSGTTAVPASVPRALLAPRVRSASLRALQAPMGIRRVEAALVAGGFDPAEVAVVAPEDLAAAIGPGTRIVGISSGDPLGLGMNSTTMAGLMGGRAYTSAWFRSLVEAVAGLRAERGLKFEVLLGGPGAWQAAAAACEGGFPVRGVDRVVLGYCEDSICELVRGIVRGERGGFAIRCEGPAADSIPPARGATTMGIVEVSRGCGLGCGFCAVGRVPMLHVPRATILADVRVNVGAGVRNISLAGEDLFRYGSRGATDIRPSEVLGLLREIRSIPGVQLIQADHANISSISEFSLEELREAGRLLAGGTGCRFVWLNVGVETAAGELLDSAGGGPKMRPFGPSEWGEAARAQVTRLIEAGFFPLVSLVVGLPGEEARHVRRTIEWVESLRRYRLAVFPMFRAPLNSDDRGFSTSNMTRDHWELFAKCYELNFMWIPPLVDDNQAAAGVGRLRRLLFQAAGRLGMRRWRRILRLRGAQRNLPEAECRPV